MHTIDNLAVIDMRAMEAEDIRVLRREAVRLNMPFPEYLGDLVARASYHLVTKGPTVRPNPAKKETTK